MRNFLGRMARVFAPRVAIFAGLGGIFFHIGHGPGHLICIIAGVGLALSGACWVIYNDFVGPWLAHRRLFRRINRAAKF